MSTVIDVHGWMQKKGAEGQKIWTLNCCYAIDSSVKEMFVVGPMYSTGPPPSLTYTAAVIKKNLHQSLVTVKIAIYTYLRVEELSLSLTLLCQFKTPDKNEK